MTTNFLRKWSSQLQSMSVISVGSDIEENGEVARLSVGPATQSPSFFHLKASLYRSTFPFTSLAVLPEHRNYLYLRQRKLTTTTKKSFGIYTCYRQWVHIWTYNYFKVIRLYTTDLIFSSLSRKCQMKQTVPLFYLGFGPSPGNCEPLMYTDCWHPGSPEKKGSHISLWRFSLNLCVHAVVHFTTALHSDIRNAFAHFLKIMDL